MLQKRRERGRISVKGIRLVEFAILHGENGDPSAPDVRYFFFSTKFLYFLFCQSAFIIYRDIKEKQKK